MRVPTAVQMDAMVRLANDEDFKIFHGWLVEDINAELLTSIKIESDPKSRWAQGRAQQLAWIIEQVKGARDNLAKVKP